MYSLWVTLQVAAEAREEFLQAIATNARASISKERGCLRFDVMELSGQPNHFAFYEVYRDQHAFEIEHKQAPHYLAFHDVAQRVVVPDSQIIIFGTVLNTFTSVD